ncbi:unnamed protein product [Spirodela intermedia]|uniref:Uncharacterized protein n=1 Tax=Spirodela intermedia TaxID=51605 RepID=A0A7I8IKU9_SPIIN|nr:unnamed protein product [Spirodela intermedia]CAA6658512.1 unnamed protein product [Spirodela intermedia]
MQRRHRPPPAGSAEGGGEHQVLGRAGVRGPAPERINGRLAMVGFVAALGVELARGTGLAAQVAEGAGLPWFVATASVLSLASLVPLFKGVTPESRSAGLMTSDAEMWNGRFAMLGLVALAFTEFVTGGPLV